MYKVYHKVSEQDSKGQTWVGEDFKDALWRCHLETTIHALEYVKPGSNVLEAGAGTGRWVKFLYDYCNITGVEISESALKEARKRHLPVYYGDVENLIYKDGTFDCVLSFGVVEHFDTPVKALLEMRRVLKPNGTLIVSVPTNNPLRFLLVNHLKTIKRLLGMLLGNKYEFEEWRYSKKDFENYLVACGFTIEKVFISDLLDPLCSGLWVDLPFLRGKKNWHLNRFGRIIRQLLPETWTNSGYIWVCVS
jgi:ubiquinone/menaquinone biosynthesis C-methylase UbiE